ncbi:MAG TPA: 4-hydroxythreonine-4-phosphate dehydrogenase PdxA [Verrucomicrobiae bacterium]|nr:4-hydroxythreonine-4-phosphate dehydrogenase PdxA [Verrucomicrobiae bacterium]
MGDPCGIGPEIIARALQRPEVKRACRCLVVGDASAMRRAMRLTGCGMELVPVAAGAPLQGEGKIFLRPVAELAEEEMVYGAPGDAAASAAFAAVCEAASLCISGAADAMATAPISKASLNRAGYSYPGHTELLAELTGSGEVVMMLAGSSLRVALVTIHEPYTRVPLLLDEERILSTIRITHQGISRYFVPKPRLAVAALNPHGGEAGLFGDEESTVIAPAVAAARREGIEVAGPLPADSLFHFASRGEYDAVVCMYHDQGLIPLKLLHFDDGVNISLGLPIIRTSVDHGTAYDLAGTGAASDASMAAAILTAASMARTAAGAGD